MTRSSLYDERFGDLRSLLGQKPSALGFARQCRAIEQMWLLEPDRVNQELVPYMERALEVWPDVLREHPMFWLRHWCPAPSQEFWPVSLLCELNLEQQCLGETLIEALATLKAWRGLSSLNVAGNQLDDEAMIQLSKIPFHGLRRLNLSQNPAQAAGLLAVVGSSWAGQLNHLEMWAMGAELGEELSPALLRLEHIERLSLSGADFSASSQAALRERLGARVVFS